MSIDNETIDKVAKLARLKIAQENKPQLAKELNDILNMVDDIQAIKTEVAPLAHPLDIVQPLRDDEVINADIPKTIIQALSSQVEDDLYIVPKVID